jgi:hydrophobic/amphiphilic exporter-1 (mainly G- bacteria), HAE1 family
VKNHFLSVDQFTDTMLHYLSDGNAIEISREVNKRLESIQASLPEGVEITIATDTTTFIVDETIDAEWSIVLGIILTIVVLYLFTGNMASTFIAAIVIPTSIISAFFLVDFSGFTINFLTMLSVATALGTLIANAIVIIESCLEHVQKGENVVEAVINGTQEVFVAVLASTGTNLVVFAPLAFMGGIVGQFMRSFGMTVIYVTIFSLIISFSLTPMLCAQFLRKRKKISSRWNILSWSVDLVNRGVDFLKEEYRVVFLWSFRYPKTVVFIVITALASTFYIIPYIGSDFRPQGDEDKITLKMSLPQGSTIERTLESVKRIEERVAIIPEVKSYFSHIGKRGVENADMTIDLIPISERNRSDVDVIEELTPFVANISDADITLARGIGIGGEGDLTIYVYGESFDEIMELSSKMRKIMEESGFFRSIASSYQFPKNEIKFIPDQKRLILDGIRGVDIGRVIRASVYGDDSNIYKEKGSEYDINVKLDERYIEDFNDVKQINIITRKGSVPVVEFGTLDTQKAMPKILHRDKMRGIQLDGYIAKTTLGHVRQYLDKEFEALTSPDGSGYMHVGNAERQDDSSREIGKAFLLAVILTYMLLAAVMNSIFYPIPIAFSIVSSFFGVFYLLFFLGESMNIASMLGMVMLVGLVVNNAILLLDYTMQEMKRGMPIVDALWEGSSKRFKPIIMTSIAIVLGVLPQMWSIMPVKSSMGTVMVGGMLASILFTFIFTPVSFWYIVRLENFLMRKK